MATNGWAALGEAFAGGGDRNERAYQQGQGRAAQLASLLAGAQIKRDEAMAREQLQESLTGAGVAPEQAGLLSTALRGGFNPAQISGYQGDVQEQGFRGDAVARALAGDWGGSNANLMGVANGPVDLASIQGQNLITNRLLPGGGGISTTEQGRAGIAADAARSAAAYASADSARASAARTRQAAQLDLAGVMGGGSTAGGKAPSGYRWDASGNLQAIPGGPADKRTAEGAAAGSDLNPRQRTAVQGVQRNLLEYASAITGTPMEQLRGKTAEQIAQHVEQNGKRTIQGGAARILSRLPGGQVLGDVNNADILSYSQGAGAAWAAFENPTGMITNADRETSTAQMPTYLDPPEVQARKIRSFLELSGYQPAGASAADAFRGAPAAATARTVIRSGTSNGRRVIQYSDGSVEYGD